MIGLDTLIILRQYDCMPSGDIVQTHDLVHQKTACSNSPLTAHTFQNPPPTWEYLPGLQSRFLKAEDNQTNAIRKTPWVPPMKSKPWKPEIAQFSPNYTDRLKPKAQTLENTVPNTVGMTSIMMSLM